MNVAVKCVLCWNKGLRLITWSWVKLKSETGEVRMLGSERNVCMCGVCADLLDGGNNI